MMTTPETVTYRWTVDRFGCHHLAADGVPEPLAKVLIVVDLWKPGKIGCYIEQPGWPKPDNYSNHREWAAAKAYAEEAVRPWVLQRLTEAAKRFDVAMVALDRAEKAMTFTTNRGVWVAAERARGRRGLALRHEPTGDPLAEFIYPADAEHAALWDPRRVEALIARDRAILDRHRREGVCSCPDVAELIAFWTSAAPAPAKRPGLIGVREEDRCPAALSLGQCILPTGHNPVIDGLPHINARGELFITDAGHAPTCPLVCCTSADDPAVIGEATEVSPS